MNAWQISATILVAAIFPLLFVAIRAPRIDALVALQLAGTIVTLVLLLLSEGFSRSSYFSLAIVIAVVSFVGTLVFARFLERSP